MKDKPETLIQPTMGIKWNFGSLLDMEAHMPSATPNYSKRTKNKQPRKEEYLEPYWANGKPTTQYINPIGHPTKRYGLIRMTTHTECAMKQEFLNSYGRDGDVTCVLPARS